MSVACAMAIAEHMDFQAVVQGPQASYEVYNCPVRTANFLAQVFCCSKKWSHLVYLLLVRFLDGFPSTPCLKNVLPLACYNFDTRERILLFLAEILLIK